MAVFELVILLLIGGAALAALARRVQVPYPALLALAGAALALLPGVPSVTLDPELALTLFVVVGLNHINTANYHPFLPNGFSGVHHGAAIVFFAYIGFDAISTAAEETKNPQRNLPLGILGGLAICTVIYVIVGAGADVIAKGFILLMLGVPVYVYLKWREQSGQVAASATSGPRAAKRPAPRPLAH